MRHVAFVLCLFAQAFLSSCSFQKLGLVECSVNADCTSGLCTAGKCGQLCAVDVDCGAGQLCGAAGVCGRAGGQGSGESTAPEISAVQGDGRGGRIGAGLTIVGVNLASVSAARLLTTSLALVGDLVIGSAEAAELHVLITPALEKLITASPDGTFMLELQGPNGITRQAVQILRGEPGAPGAPGATGATGETGPPGMDGTNASINFGMSLSGPSGGKGFTVSVHSGTSTLPTSYGIGGECFTGSPCAGVAGVDSSGSSVGYGVLGRSNSLNGRAIYGHATGSGGKAILGETDGANGIGVWGKATPTASDGVGVTGQAEAGATNGIGVYGTASGGAASIGVRAVNSSGGAALEVVGPADFSDPSTALRMPWRLVTTSVDVTLASETVLLACASNEIVLGGSCIVGHAAVTLRSFYYCDASKVEVGSGLASRYCCAFTNSDAPTGRAVRVTNMCVRVY